MRIYFRDASGSFVYTLKDTPITLITPDGPQRIPVADIRQISFAQRDPDTGSIKGRKTDVVHTADAKLTGTLEGAWVQTHNPMTVDQLLDFTNMKKLVALTKKQARDYFTFEAPDTLVIEGHGFGRTKRYRLVGRTEGPVYGTDVYALNSRIDAAAVHAGRVRAGKKGVVEVEIVPSPAHFEGSTRNGVTSEAADAFPMGAFRFLEPEPE